MKIGRQTGKIGWALWGALVGWLCFGHIGAQTPPPKPALALPGAKPAVVETPRPRPAIPPSPTPRPVLLQPTPRPRVSLPQVTSATQAAQQAAVATPSAALADSIRAHLEKPTSASAASEAAQTGRLFRIGFLSASNEDTQDYEGYRQIQQHLRQDPLFRKTMADAGLTDLHLRPCDGPEDMLQRMGQAEFDLVFCPAMVYAQDRIARANVYEPASGAPGPDRYLVFSKTMRPVVAVGADSRGRHIARTGVLFKRKTPTLEKKSVKTLLGDPAAVLAVSGAHDAAGYFYVRKMLWDEYERCAPKFLFYGSPQNVVKAVVSGLCDVGACEESVLREMLAELSDNPELELSHSDTPYVTVINRTQPVPTDPILIRSEYGPGMSGAAVGLEMRRSLRRLYEKGNPNAPRVLLGDEELERAYKEMIDDMKQMQGL